MSRWISYPTTKITGSLCVPGDKSISHRALFLGAIAQGATTIDGLLTGEDCMRTWRIFEALGVHIVRVSDSITIIHGVGKYGLKPASTALDCGNSGTTMRLLMGLLAAQPFDSLLTGDQSLQQRPMERVSIPLRQMGAQIFTTSGCAPIKIQGNPSLHGVAYTMPQASAQVKTALLLAGLYAEDQTKLTELMPTRDHTERMLAAFACKVRQSNHVLTVDKTSVLQGTHVTIPGDISSAAFFIVAATLTPGSDIIIKNVGVNPTRLGVIHVLKQMGAWISMNERYDAGFEPVADVHVRYAPLHGAVISADIVPYAIDEFPILFIAAACASGQTCFQRVGELRHKESDRIAVMMEGLQHLRINARVLHDDVWIDGGVLHGGTVSSYHDHRVAMAFAIAGAVAKTPVTVLDCQAVSTSFPQFTAVANQINLTIEEQS